MADMDLAKVAEFLSLLPDLHCVLDGEGRFVSANPGWSTFLARDVGDLIGLSFVDWMHPDDRGKTSTILHQLRNGNDEPVHFESRYQRDDKQQLTWLAMGARSFRGSILVSAKDITTTKANETFLEDVQHQAHIGGWSLDPTTLKTKWTTETYRIHEVPMGTKTEALMGINFYHPEDQPKIAEHVRRCMVERTPFDDDLRFVTATGRALWVRATGYPVIDTNGEVSIIQGTFQDITRRKMLEIEREQRARQLERITSGVPGIVYQFERRPDGTYTFTYASEKAFEIYEIEPEDFAKNPGILLEMVHPEEVPDLIPLIELSAQALTPFEWRGRILTKTGKVKWLRAGSLPEARSDGSIQWDGIIVDVTNEHNLATALAHQQRLTEQASRLASIGELAAGVGHEVNNPLAIAAGTMDLLRAHFDRQFPDDALTTKMLGRVDTALDRIRRIVDGLRNYARLDVTPETVGSLGNAVVSTIGLVQDIYKRDGISIECHYQTAEIPVSCDNGRLQQVAMNLLSNARDALTDPTCTHEEKRIVVRIAVEGGLARLDVEDNGVGIPESLQSQVFSEFFTTKPIGKGTGLGLSISSTIVRTCGGTIDCVSTPGVGTKFSILLPLAAPPPRASEAPEIQRLQEARSVLVVDDEPDLREVYGIFFENMGYEVTAVENAKAALNLLRERRFDVLFTDLKMPEIDGMELLRQSLDLDPSRAMIRILVSGGSVNELSRAAPKPLASYVDQFMHKPFDQRDLQRCLESAWQARATTV